MQQYTEAHTRQRIRSFLLILAMAVTLPACSDSDDSPTGVAAGEISDAASGDIIVVDETGTTSIDLGELGDAVDEIPLEELSSEESAAILFMREEEKLAHDVYLSLYDTWGLSIFQNIARSEQSHTDAVRTLIERYDLEDPSAVREGGEFANTDLQALHDALVAAGEESLSQALRVGGAIEEIDILDLAERMAQTRQEDILLVYENLMTGSENHLRSFVSTLKEQTGEEYAPQYLSVEVYTTIVDSTATHGSSNGNGSDNGNRGGG